MRARRLRSFAALVFFLASGFAPAPSVATTITVTTTADDTTVNGNCTLREAIIASNTDTVQDACPAGNGADTVVVPAGIYKLALAGRLEDAAATGDLDITADVDIVGTGGVVTIEGSTTGENDRIFDVDPGHAGITVTLTNLVIVDGVTSAGDAQGGGIRNAGTLTVQSCDIVGNYALTDTGLDAEGGGIYNSGTLHVIGSQVAGNNAVTNETSQPSVALGAGIRSTGTLTITDSTITANAATVRAPGSTALGAIACTSGTIVDSTISGNGVGIAAAGVVTFSNSTSDDGVTVVAPGTTLVFQNTIVSGCADSTGTGFTTIADDYNVDVSDTCHMSGATDLHAVDPQLGRLQDNGGPTPTRALLPGSPVVNAGNPAAPGSGGGACEATDQRGIARPQEARCDIGAFEGVGAIAADPCPATPRDCAGASPSGSRIVLKNSGIDSKDLLSWSWHSSAAVAAADFGDPLTSAAFAVCIYDQDGAQLRMQTGVAGGADGACADTNGKPCWRALAAGFAYRNRFLTPEGISRITLVPGASGAAKLKVAGRGANLRTAMLPLTPSVRVQLLRQDSSNCWEADFSGTNPSLRNDAQEFKAKSE